MVETGFNMDIAAVAAATTLQIRILGGAISLAIFSNIINSRIQSSPALTSTEKQQLSTTPQLVVELPPDKQQIVANIFSGSFRDFLVVIAVAGAISFILVCGAIERIWHRYLGPQPTVAPMKSQLQNSTDTCLLEEHMSSSPPQLPELVLHDTNLDVENWISEPSELRRPYELHEPLGISKYIRLKRKEVGSGRSRRY
jgi:hypothetical protein